MQLYMTYSCLHCSFLHRGEWVAWLLGQAHESYWLQGHPGVPEGQPLPGVVPDRAERSALAQPVPDAAPLRQEGLQLLPADLRASLRPQTTQEGVGGRQSETEVDSETSKKFVSLSFKLFARFVLNPVNARLFLRIPKYLNWKSITVKGQEVHLSNWQWGFSECLH